jgi:putative addiction module component (TIGR02574 family)
MANDLSNSLSPTADQILQAALGLSESERATVAGKIIESLGLELGDYTDEEWAAEVARRDRELEDGTAETTSWDEALQLIREAGEKARDS